MRRLKYFIQDFRWVKALFSPFRPFTVKFYAGKIAVGVPYFYPRKWVKVNKQDALRMATEYSQKKGHIHYDKDPNTLIDQYMNYTKPVPLKVGFSYCGLGWKTKWTSTDFRYEWGPVFSFVFFGYQIAMMIGHEHASHYWEAWLYYEYATDKTKSKRERVEQCRREFNQTWTVCSKDKEEVVDYYERILKPKYLK